MCSRSARRGEGPRNPHRHEEALRPSRYRLPGAIRCALHPGPSTLHACRSAGYDHLARQVAGLSRHVLDSRPMHGEQHRVRLLRGLSRRSCLDLALGAAGELLELPLAAGVAEYHLRACTRRGGWTVVGWVSATHPTKTESRRHAPARVDAWVWTEADSPHRPREPLLITDYFPDGGGFVSNTRTQSPSPSPFVPGGVNLCLPVFASGNSSTRA
jgi:hypothetical protein